MDPLKSIAAFDPAKRAFSLWDEFKNFAFKGNVIDLAVGVIIGAAFGNIVNSLVKNIIMPVVALVAPSGQEYTKWAFSFQEGGPSVPYGQFLGDVVNFFIVAVALYLFIVKFLGLLLKSKRAQVAAPPPLTKDQELLTQIRDFLERNPTPAPAK